ncbi:uncharacterized protein LOC133287977 [Gastrolobium bilobum]|uniref:uncharacterized protein LOC133287977 n=1 Tax=Gastrolobium bilobum TaxID=150636 RepID=UPI002AB1A581|nr:uncharacterized protein LOC133287977 [Gastrolobium bilobum]
MLEGLQLAWDHSCRRVWLEGDSSSAIHLIKEGCQSHHSLAPLVDKIQMLLRRDWCTFVSRVHREGNSVADMLASLASPSDWDLHVLDSVPPTCWEVMKKDLMGATTPRMIRDVSSGTA